MAKSIKGASKSTITSKKAPAKAVTRTEVRNSPIPKAAVKAPSAVAAAVALAPATREIPYERIAVRAYEIWASGAGGSAFDNWLRAERELRGV